ncbi:beta-lactamase-like protein [Phlebopus sp. FC_14]|nr:beta-lactamase-like protein [Phlebopus sp. FC_14]
MSKATTTLLPPAANQAYFDVSALEAGNVVIPMDRIVAGAKHEFLPCPALAFSLRHSKTSFQMVFDLGVRRDIEGYPPALQKRIRDLGFSPVVKQTVAESLERGGIAPDQVDAVIVSHLHWDHIGDCAPFTKATFIVGSRSKDLLATGYPGNPDAVFSSTAVPVDRTRFISVEDMSTSIGPFPHALDYFGDGSLYIVDAPGHISGHINALVRTSADGSWILLAGDSAHDRRIVTGEKEVAHSIDAVTGHVVCMHANKEQAQENIRRVRSLLDVPKVQVLIAHDVPWYNVNAGGTAFLPGIIPPVI